MNAIRTNINKNLFRYGSDFGNTSKETLQKLAELVSNTEMKLELQKAADSDFRIDYSDYDWALNST